MKHTPVWSWRDAVRKAKIAPLTKLVCYTLSNYLSDVGEGCFPSIKTLEADTGLSNRSLATHLEKASEAGLLEIRRKARNGRCNVYLPKFPEDAKLAEQPALDLGDSQVNEAHVNEAHVNEAHVTSEGGSSHHVKEVHTNSPRNSPSKKKHEQTIVCSAGGEDQKPEEPEPPAKPKKGNPIYTKSFEDFWQAYPRKKGKADAARKWQRMSEEQRKLAKDAIPAYVADCRKENRAFRWGSTYLNGHTWDDYVGNSASDSSNDDEHLVRLVLNYGKDKSTWTPRLEEKLGPPPDHPECRIKRWIIDRAREVWRSERDQQSDGVAYA